MRKMLGTFFAILVAGLAVADTPVVSVDQLLGQYYMIHRSLAADSTSGVLESAAQMAKISRQAAGREPQAKAQLIALSDTAAKFQAADLKSARNGFGDLSDRLIAYLQAARAKRNPPYQFFCPMVKKNWLQADKAPRNPYFGSSMLTCGELVPPGQSAEQSHHH